MLTNYGYIGLFLIVAVIFTVTTLLIPVTLRIIRIVPHKPNPVKNSPFECGMETIGKTWVQFNFRYYFYALLFIAVDVIAVFLYPWAADLRNLGLSAFVTMLVFIALIVVGIIYAWKKKVMEWK